MMGPGPHPWTPGAENARGPFFRPNGLACRISAPAVRSGRSHCCNYSEYSRCRIDDSTTSPSPYAGALDSRSTIRPTPLQQNGLPCSPSRRNPDSPLRHSSGILPKSLNFGKANAVRHRLACLRLALNRVCVRSAGPALLPMSLTRITPCPEPPLSRCSRPITVR